MCLLSYGMWKFRISNLTNDRAWFLCNTCSTQLNWKKCILRTSFVCLWSVLSIFYLHLFRNSGFCRCSYISSVDVIVVLIGFILQNNLFMVKLLPQLCYLYWKVGNLFYVLTSSNFCAFALLKAHRNVDIESGDHLKKVF